MHSLAEIISAVVQACNPLGGVESCMTLPSDSTFAQVCPGHDLKVCPYTLILRAQKQHTTRASHTTMGPFNSKPVTHALYWSSANMLLRVSHTY